MEINEEAPAPQEPRSPAQTPAEAVYDEVMLKWFEEGSNEPLPRELVLDAAVALVDHHPNYRQLGVASALLVMLTAERDTLLGVITRSFTQKLYVVMVNDRHLDPEAKVFTTKEAALAYARETAEHMGLVDDHIDEWLYYASHPSESDSIWVIEQEINS